MRTFLPQIPVCTCVQAFVALWEPQQNGFVNASFGRSISEETLNELTVSQCTDFHHFLSHSVFVSNDFHSVARMCWKFFLQFPFNLISSKNGISTPTLFQFKFLGDQLQMIDHRTNSCLEKSLRLNNVSPNRFNCCNHFSFLLLWSRNVSLYLDEYLWMSDFKIEHYRHIDKCTNALKYLHIFYFRLPQQLFCYLNRNWSDWCSGFYTKFQIVNTNQERSIAGTVKLLQKFVWNNFVKIDVDKKKCCCGWLFSLLTGMNNAIWVFEYQHDTVICFRWCERWCFAYECILWKFESFKIHWNRDKNTHTYTRTLKCWRCNEIVYDFRAPVIF